MKTITTYTVTAEFIVATPEAAKRIQDELNEMRKRFNSRGNLSHHSKEVEVTETTSRLWDRIAASERERLGADQ